jgi:hypothetical protein
LKAVYRALGVLVDDRVTFATADHGPVDRHGDDEGHG